MTKKLLILSLFLNALLIIAACGGVSMLDTPTTSEKLHAFVGAVPGFHGGSTAAKNNASNAFYLSLVPRANAQTATPTPVTFTGSFSGFCPSVTAPAGTATLFYGVGTLDQLACNNTVFSGNTNNSLTAAANAGGSSLVIGNGTIGPLVAYAQQSTSTVHIWVNRGGQVLDSGISAAVNGTRGQSDATFAVQDSDTISAVIESDGNPSTNLQFVLAKN